MKIIKGENLRIDALQLINGGAGYLDAAIRAGNGQGQPLDNQTLKIALDIERRCAGARVTVIRLLERELMRQAKQQAVAA